MDILFLGLLKAVISQLPSLKEAPVVVLSFLALFGAWRAWSHVKENGLPVLEVKLHESTVEKMGAQLREAIDEKSNNNGVNNAVKAKTEPADERSPPN